MGDCPICRRGEPHGIIGERSVSWFTAPDRPPMIGYLCVVSKRHVEEPFELPADERAAFWEETLTAAQVVSRLFRPRRMNYEIHGNTIPHLHVHLFPRYPGDPFEGRPIDARQSDVEWPAGALDKLRAALA